MERLPDTIYIVDPYDEDGNLVTNTEDVCWCEDPAGNENVAYVSRATVAAALRELRELRNGLECIQERAQRMRGSASGDRPMKSATQACAWIAESTPALLKQIDATVAALGLDGKEKCFDCGASQVADTCPECGKSFCAVCVEKDESCCDKGEAK